MKLRQHLTTVLLTLLTATLLNTVSAQEAIELPEGGEDNRGWNVSAAVGTSVFLGDIKTNPLLPALKDLSELRYVAVLGGERRFNPWIAGRLHFAYSHVLGTRKPWNVHFQSYVWESGLTGLFYPINLFTEYDESRFADFFIVAGIGAINYNTTLYQYNTGNVLAKRGYGAGRGISGTTLSGILLGGLGADFRLSDKFDLRVEIKNKGISNDKLDIWESNFRFDVYNHITFGLVYKLGQGSRGSDLSLPPDTNKDGIDLWSNIPAKPQEKKDVTENLQFTPVIEIPAEKPKAEPEAVTVTDPVSAAVFTQTQTLPNPVPVVKPVAANEFKVQVFATSRPFSKAELAKRFRLNENEISEDRFQQYYIYSVGSFASMDEALSMRDKLRRENGVSDAFVTIWENGQRVGPRFK